MPLQEWKRVTRMAVVPRSLLVGDEASGATQGFHGGDQVGHQMQLINFESWLDVKRTRGNYKIKLCTFYVALNFHSGQGSMPEKL